MDMDRDSRNDAGRPSIMGLITARGGSKSIPKKNTKDLAGRPMIAWTIAAAREAQLLDRVIVSTDSPEIADICRAWGAEAPFLRPAELAGDDSPHVDVLLHALDWMNRHQDYRPEYLLLLQPTSPLRTGRDIDAAVALGLDRDADGVVGVCEAATHPYLVKSITGDGRLIDFIKPPEGYLRRQDLPPVHAINGAIYLVKSSIIKERRTWFTEKTHAYVMPPERSLDVDTPWDFHLVELVLNERRAAAREN